MSRNEPRKEKKARGLLALLPFLLSLAFALTPAGTVIRNQAVALVAGERYLSNPVETVVQAVCRPLLFPDGTPTTPGLSLSAPPGGYAYLPYRLKNGGNAPFTFALSYALHGTPPWTPGWVRFYLDLNGNASLDPGEPEVGEVALGAGEERALILALSLPPTASGDLLITPVALCPSGERDDANYARVRAGGPPEPALYLSKAASPGRILPGERATFTLVLRNLGGGEAAGPLYLTDLLGGLEGLAYVPGSAHAPKGQVEFYDGATWHTAEPGTVLGLRLVLPRLLPGEEALLAFQVEARPGAAPGARANRARAEGPGGPAEAEAALEVLPLYLHHLGPYGNPKALPGGEMSGEDLQRGGALEGELYCFRHTLLNEGTGMDTYRLLLEPTPASYRLETLLGTPLPDPLALGPGERLDFQLCLLAPPGTHAFTLTARSLATGQENRTRDLLEVGPRGALTLRKEASPAPGTTLRAGDEVVYTLVVENAFGPLSGVRIEDALPPWVEFLEAPGGTYDPGRHRVLFALDSLPTGTARFTVRVRVKPDAPEEALLQNRFTLFSQETPEPLVSNEVAHPLLSLNLALEKRVSPGEVAVGGVLTYTLKVTNPASVPLEVRLTDTPDPRLRYLEGSARGGPCGGALSPMEPVLEGGTLRWTFPLGPKASLCLEYRMRVLLGGGGVLENVAQAQGLGAQGGDTAKVQARALARMRLGPSDLEGGVLLGRVYLDVNRNGRYDPGEDIPLPGARLVLANGWQTLTDREGRYAFRGLDPGVWQVMLDPASAPFPPRPHPEALGEGYRHGVRVQGLTVSDFPLEAPRGLAEAYRETTLRFGPLTVEKRLFPLEKGYRVVLVLRSAEPLTELTVRDPLPGGEEKVFAFPRFEGEEVLEYALEEPFMSDPQVRWRYP
ncbi:hypothetical protein [Thermus sp.]|uniref:hypothetical protein n=1 Tax=Thermus sp. TaxID=275 RepID=UPI003D0C551B